MHALRSNSGFTLEMLAKLCLKNSLEIRELQSAILCTVIVPRDYAIAVAGSDAAKNPAERMRAVHGNERKIDAHILKGHFGSITKPGSDPKSAGSCCFRKAWDT